MGNQELAILTTKLMMTTMMTPPIIFVPAKRATCWQRNARDRATGHRHYTRCWRLRSFFINRGFIVINTNIIWMSQDIIKWGTFSFLLHPRLLLRWLLMAFQVPTQWQSESFYWICYDTRTPWFGQSQVLKLLSSHYQRDKSGIVWARGAPSKLPNLAK